MRWTLDERRGSTTLVPKPRADFVETDQVRELTRRGLGFLKAGYSLHFRGPAGTGKTTLALHVAAQLGRPVIVVTGDNELGTADLVGSQRGYHYRKVVDQFIHNVTKFEETANQRWTDHRLTTACREGYTLVYDEFTRSPARDAQCSSERPRRTHSLPAGPGQGRILYPRSPGFPRDLHEQPQEYAGVHSSQDALADRLATIDVDYPDREMELAVTVARTGLSQAAAARITDLVRSFRASGDYQQTPTLRTSLMIARVAAQEGYRVAADDPHFVQLCLDVLEARIFTGARMEGEERRQRREILLALIANHCPPAPARARRSSKARAEGNPS